MQFTPTQSELNSLVEMDATERLQYFLTRTVEVEEVWALSEPEGWVLNEEGERAILQVWPYEQLANDCVNNAIRARPAATSLDHFIYSLLGNMIEKNIELEILPTKIGPGTFITAIKLNELYESMLDAGDYYLEG